VLEVSGSSNGNLKYSWKHAAFDESGQESWVPGRQTKLKSAILTEREMVKKKEWKGACISYLLFVLCCSSPSLLTLIFCREVPQDLFQTLRFQTLPLKVTFQTAQVTLIRIISFVYVPEDLLCFAGTD